MLQPFRSPSVAGATILVVEADRVARLILADFLQRQGYDVLQAGTVGDALTQLARHEVRLAFIASDASLADRLARHHPALAMIVAMENVPNTEDIRARRVIRRNDLNALRQHSLELLRRLH